MESHQPFRSADEAWAALVEQQGISDGDLIDLWNHQLQTADALMDAGADDELVVAGLLHDLGDGRVAEAEHGPWAARLVRPLLGERVAWVIAAHADASAISAPSTLHTGPHFRRSRSKRCSSKEE